jgi:hypothetical protein
MPSEPVARVNREAVLIGNKIIARFQTQLFSEAVAEALNAALSPLVEAGKELKEVHVALGGNVESEMRYGQTVELAKQAIAKAYEDGRKAGLEEAAKAICGHCAEGWVVRVIDGRAQHETFDGREECTAYPIRALKEPKP